MQAQSFPSSESRRLVILCSGDTDLPCALEGLLVTPVSPFPIPPHSSTSPDSDIPRPWRLTLVSLPSSEVNWHPTNLFPRSAASRPSKTLLSVARLTAFPDHQLDTLKMKLSTISIGALAAVVTAQDLSSLAPCGVSIRCPRRDVIADLLSKPVRMTCSRLTRRKSWVVTRATSAVSVSTRTLPTGSGTALLQCVPTTKAKSSVSSNTASASARVSQ